MAKYIYKVSQPGTGKTRWLMENALAELEQGNNVTLLTVDSRVGSMQYQKFVEDFFARFHIICKVRVAKHVTEIAENDVVLIDDLMKLSKHLDAFNLVDTRASRVYVTMNGVTAEEWETVEKPDPNQLSCFDEEDAE